MPQRTHPADSLHHQPAHVKPAPPRFTPSTEFRSKIPQKHGIPVTPRLPAAPFQHTPPAQTAHSLRQPPLRSSREIMQNFKQILLSDEEKQSLNSQLTNPRTAPRQKLRALIILELASGLSNLQTAAKLGCSRRTVGIWRQRFLQERLPALTPRNHRAGRKPTLRNSCRECVIAHLKLAGDSTAAPSIRSIARACNVSKDTVHRIAREHGLATPRRTTSRNASPETQRAPDETVRGPADNHEITESLSSRHQAATADCPPDPATPNLPRPELPQVPVLPT